MKYLNLIQIFIGAALWMIACVECESNANESLMEDVKGERLDSKELREISLDSVVPSQNNTSEKTNHNDSLKSSITNITKQDGQGIHYVLLYIQNKVSQLREKVQSVKKTLHSWNSSDFNKTWKFNLKAGHNKYKRRQHQWVRREQFVFRPMSLPSGLDHLNPYMSYKNFNSTSVHGHHVRHQNYQSIATLPYLRALSETIGIGTVIIAYDVTDLNRNTTSASQ